MRKLLQKVLTLSMALCFCASLITLPVHADRPEDTSTKAYIHHVQDVFTENKTEVCATPEIFDFFTKILELTEAHTEL